MRMDNFFMLQPLLKKHFFVENHTYFSILPSTAEFARNALLSGMYPLEFSKAYPDIWNDILENKADRNRHEGTLLKKKLESCGVKLGKRLEYHRLADEHDAQEIIANFDSCKKKRMVTLVVDFIEKFIEDQTTAKVLQDIAPDDTAFRKLTYSWFERSKLFEILKLMAEKNCTVIFTTSSGSILCTRGTEYYGSDCMMESLRYRCGERVTCDERYAFYVHEPERFNLPKKTAETSYVILKENYYFINHDTYHNYNEQYQNTFQRGGISMEEIIVPLAILKPKLIDL